MKSGGGKRTHWRKLRSAWYVEMLVKRMIHKRRNPHFVLCGRCLA